MNRTEHLLCILAEECAEVAHRASKALRFGLAEVQPGQALTNAKRLADEVNDFVAVYQMLAGPVVAPTSPLFAGDPAEWLRAVDAKQAKVEKFLAYSATLGTLDGAVETPATTPGLAGKHEHFLVGVTGGSPSMRIDWARQEGWPIVSINAVRKAFTGRVALKGKRAQAVLEPWVLGAAETAVHALFNAGHRHVILEGSFTRTERDDWKSDRYSLYWHNAGGPDDIALDQDEPRWRHGEG